MAVTEAGCSGSFSTLPNGHLLFQVKDATWVPESQYAELGLKAPPKHFYWAVPFAVDIESDQDGQSVLVSHITSGAPELVPSSPYGGIENCAIKK